MQVQIERNIKRHISKGGTGITQSVIRVNYFLLFTDELNVRQRDLVIKEKNDEVGAWMELIAVGMAESRNGKLKCERDTCQFYFETNAKFSRIPPTKHTHTHERDVRSIFALSDHVCSIHNSLSLGLRKQLALINDGVKCCHMDTRFLIG